MSAVDTSDGAVLRAARNWAEARQERTAAASRMRHLKQVGTDDAALFEASCQLNVAKHAETKALRTLALASGWIPGTVLHQQRVREALKNVDRRGVAA